MGGFPVFATVALSTSILHSQRGGGVFFFDGLLLPKFGLLPRFGPLSQDVRVAALIKEDAAHAAALLKFRVADVGGRLFETLYSFPLVGEHALLDRLQTL